MPDHYCDQAVPIAKIQADQSNMKDLVTQISEQYRQTLKKLDDVAELLKDNAVNKAEIEHINREQQAQWRKIEEVKSRVDSVETKLTSKIETHLETCKGPELAMAKAVEALGVAKDAAAVAKTATEMVDRVSRLPGKWAIGAIVAIGGVASNILTAVIVNYLLTH